MSVDVCNGAIMTTGIGGNNVLQRHHHIAKPTHYLLLVRLPAPALIQQRCTLRHQGSAKFSNSFTGKFEFCNPEKELMSYQKVHPSKKGYRPDGYLLEMFHNSIRNVRLEYLNDCYITCDFSRITSIFRTDVLQLRSTNFD